MEKQRWFDSLQSQLTALFGLLVVALAVSVAFMLGAQISARIERQRSVTLQGDASNTARALERGLQDRGREIAVLAQSADIWRDGLESPTVRAMLARTQAINPANTWIGVADREGTLRAATGGLMVGRNARDRPWFGPGLEAPHVGDVHAAKMLAAYFPREANGEPLRFVDVAAPINVDGRVIGVLVSHGSWGWADQVVKALAPLDAAKRQIQTFIFDKNGKMLYAPDGRLEGQVAAGQELPREATFDRPGFVATWSDGVSYLASAVRLEPHAAANQALGWIIVSRQPMKSVREGARQAVADALQLGMVAALIAAAIAWAVARRLTRPLRALAAAVRRVAAQEPGATIPVVGGSVEVRSLSLALVEMTDRLERSHQALEARVRERTEQVAGANRRLEQLASTDPMTGLLNRRGLDLQLKYATSLARRDGSDLSLILLDADHFQHINDAYGHDVGDATLQRIAAAMKTRLRASDVLARIGGEAFVALLPQTDAGGARRVAESLVRTIAAECVPPVGRITVSCGVSQVALATDDGTDALRRADQALCRAKAGGRNRVEFDASSPIPLGSE